MSPRIEHFKVLQPHQVDMQAFQQQQQLLQVMQQQHQQQQQALQNQQRNLTPHDSQVRTIFLDLFKVILYVRGW